MFNISPKKLVYLFIYALANTILSFGIVYIINNALAGEKAFLKDYMGMVFLVLVVYTYLLNIVFQKHLNKFSFKLLYDNEKKVFAKILNSPLVKLEQLGPQRFFSTVEDLRVFSLLPFTVTHTINSILMILLCLIYMFFLSVVSASVVIGIIALVVVCYFIVMNTMSKEIESLREYNDDYYRYVDDVIKGFKELKLSFFRRENLMNRFLIPNRDTSEKLDYKVTYVFLSINLISQYGLYVVIAVTLFVLPEMGVLDRADVIAYVVIILFISGPINNIINLQQTYTRFMVADKRIKKFNEDFDNDLPLTHHEEISATVFSSLDCKDIAFNYGQGTDENSFNLGPLNLTIQQGETVFVVGGNGSGKSTFINILTGLYQATEGNILLNGKKEATEGALQNLITAVFTDNHIFSHNYENYDIEENEEYAKLLETLELDHVVKDTKEESARRKFSKGQSKRMSLIFALLEKKPILVLDEWAADQDPHFRKFFYEVLIPRLKQQGKTIIAVTHDDAYFHIADRVVKFDYGQIVKDVSTKHLQKAGSMIW